jgi:hypothetical protein
VKQAHLQLGAWKDLFLPVTHLQIQAKGVWELPEYFQAFTGMQEQPLW